MDGGHVHVRGGKVVSHPALAGGRCRVYAGEYILWIAYWWVFTLPTMKSLRQAFGTVVARRRKDAGFSQEEFAYRAKVHRTYMTGIETGKHNPSLDVLELIAIALKLDVSEMLQEAEREGRPTRKT